MADISCPIWGTAATEARDSDADALYVVSPRAGGLFTITGSAVPGVQQLSTNEKLMLTTWLCEQRRAGAENPQIDTATLDFVKARRPLSFMKRFTAALEYVGSHIERLGDRLKLRDDCREMMELLAETESNSGIELRELLRLLADTGFLEVSIHSSGADARPTARGWEEIERLIRTQVDSSQAFVAMWFNSVTKDAYDLGIAPAIRNCGYSPIRIDNKEHSNKIDDEIIAEIRRSRFMVADFTCEKNRVRGGVYYEADLRWGWAFR